VTSEISENHDKGEKTEMEEVYEKQAAYASAGKKAMVIAPRAQRISDERISIT